MSGLLSSQDSLRLEGCKSENMVIGKRKSSLPHRRGRREIDLHFLRAGGRVACNPRDREAAPRAEVAGIATEDRTAVTCKKCLAVNRRLAKEMRA
jgi:hypothetical protein